MRGSADTCTRQCLLDRHSSGRRSFDYFAKARNKAENLGIKHTTADELPIFCLRTLFIATSKPVLKMDSVP